MNEAVMCEQCGQKMQSVKGMRIHVGRMHKKQSSVPDTGVDGDA